MIGADDITTREQLVRFIEDLSDRAPSMTNNDLCAYLDALAAWLADCDGYFRNRGESAPDQPTWRMVAQALEAAADYE